jgi:hypothetical protein
VLTVATGFPPGYRAVRADVLDEGHEGADVALEVRSVLHGHQRFLSD